MRSISCEWGTGGEFGTFLLVSGFTPFCFIIKTPQKLPGCDKPCGEAHISRNQGILSPTTSEELNPINNHVSEGGSESC